MQFAAQNCKKAARAFGNKEALQVQPKCTMLQNVTPRRAARQTTQVEITTQSMSAEGPCLTWEY